MSVKIWDPLISIRAIIRAILGAEMGQNLNFDNFKIQYLKNRPIDSEILI